jgi:HEAT repeat protein
MNRLLALFLLIAASAQAQLSTDDAFEFLPIFHYGQNDEALTVLHDAVIAAQSDAEARTTLNARFAGLLGNPEATHDAKLFACKMLLLVGDASTVPALAPLLLDAELSHVARYALEKLPGAEADAALLEALSAAPDGVKAGIINALAMRRAAGAVPALAPLVDDASGAEVRDAALAALGRLGEQDAVALEKLSHLWAASTEENEDPRGRALLQAATGHATRGEHAIAFRPIMDVMERTKRTNLRCSALESLAVANPEICAAHVVDWLRQGTDAEARCALQQARLLQHDGLIDNLTGIYPMLAPERRTGLLAALAGRGDPQALQVIHTALTSAEPAEQAAAFRAAGELGDGSSVGPLFAAATGQRDAALAALSALVGGNVDHALMERLGQGAAEERVLAAAALGSRRASEAFDVLASLTTDADATLGEAAAEAMGQVAAPPHAAAMLAMVQYADDNVVRDRAAGALTALLRRSPTGVYSEDLLSAIAETKDATGRTALVRVAGATADAAFLPMLQSLAAEEPAALDALANWPTPEPMDALLEIGKSAAGEARDTALEGYLRHLRKATLDEPAKLARYEEVMPLSDSSRVRRAVLAGAGELKGMGALDFVESFMETEGLKRESRVAAESIRRQFYTATASDNPSKASLALDGKPGTRWTSGRVQAPGMWFQLDMSRNASIGGIVLDAARSASDSPVAYSVYVFDDPADKGAAVAEGAGDTPVLDLKFEPKRGRYVRIEQSGTSTDAFWSIHELRVVPR